MTTYELISDRHQYSYWRIVLLVLLCMSTTTLVFLCWNLIYDNTEPQIPPKLNSIPDWWVHRALNYTNSTISHDIRLVKNQSYRFPLHPTKLEPQSTINVPDFIEPNDSPSNTVDELRLVCYYDTPRANQTYNTLRLTDVDSNLCTHINIGIVSVQNASLIITQELKDLLHDQIPLMRKANPNLKLLLWIGSGDNGHDFAAMIKDHATRKIFIKSLKKVLQEHLLDGIDLDFEFPSAYKKERQHFSQLLYEIRQEFKRERKTYLLSVAVAAPEGIALFAYDIRELNIYADYVNLMTYDFHFYSHSTPFTGLNAPLYARANEKSILATININYTVHWWLANGLERKKLVVGLPTYGHSYTLVSALNNRIGAPALGYGRCGDNGFTSYSEICWFYAHNLFISKFYDEQSCSPFVSSGTEWISFENTKSLECKTNFIKALNLGGVMIFSLNTDDYKNICKENTNDNEMKTNISLPLVNSIKKILLKN